jgi:hypothetical protein
MGLTPDGKTMTLTIHTATSTAIAEIELRMGELSILKISHRLGYLALASLWFKTSRTNFDPLARNR